MEVCTIKSVLLSHHKYPWKVLPIVKLDPLALPSVRNHLVNPRRMFRYFEKGLIMIFFIIPSSIQTIQTYQLPTHHLNFSILRADWSRLSDAA